jgi:hypothetical protein
MTTQNQKCTAVNDFENCLLLSDAGTTADQTNLIEQTRAAQKCNPPTAMYPRLVVENQNLKIALGPSK